MKEKWINLIGILSIITIGLPSYAYARGGYGDAIGSLLITLLVIVVIFLIFREIICWYWKINEHLSVLKDISDKLSVLHDMRNILISIQNSAKNKEKKIKKVKKVTNTVNKQEKSQVTETLKTDEDLSKLVACPNCFYMNPPGVACKRCKHTIVTEKIKSFI